MPISISNFPWQQRAKQINFSITIIRNEIRFQLCLTGEVKVFCMGLDHKIMEYFLHKFLVTSYLNKF